MSDLTARINNLIRITEGAGKRGVSITIDDAKAVVVALEAAR
tara:strand:+ start:1611 stop:1736 length:126 start_codon:yes stop_codon:yes gene_type:complete